MSTRKRLGLGLESLLGGGPRAQTQAGVEELDPRAIRPNPYQPRSELSDDSLGGLVASIRSTGILQPLIVRRTDEGPQLVAGERRLRASIAAGLDAVPVIFRDVADERLLEIALIENIQREDLNPIDKGRAFGQLVAHLGETQEAVAERLGIDRSTMVNFMRLLELPKDIQDAVASGLISAGHARALLSLREEPLMRAAFTRLVKEGLTVRAVERLVSKLGEGRPEHRLHAGGTPKTAHLGDLEQRLTEALGTRVTIQPRRKGGKIVIEFANSEVFEGVMDRLLPSDWRM